MKIYISDNYYIVPASLTNPSSSDKCTGGIFRDSDNFRLGNIIFDFVTIHGTGNNSKIPLSNLIIRVNQISKLYSDCEYDLLNIIKGNLAFASTKEELMLNQIK